MTRVIKFRAYHKRDKEMSEFSFTDNLVAIDDKDHLVVCSDTGGWDFNDEDLVIMQFTGLLDREGKEIYEGDLIDCRDMLSGVEFVAPVEFIESGFWVKMPSGQLSMPNKERRIIVGNIFEHPEPLEEKL